MVSFRLSDIRFSCWKMRSTSNAEYKRSRSIVWDYFEKLDIEGQSKCLLCKIIIKHPSNTSNLAKVS